MDFIFWQNIISIHQKAFLEALVNQAGVGNVTLVVEHELTPVRKSMGWDTPDIKGVEIILSPSDKKIDEIVAATKDGVHIMGGIRIGRMITRAFDACAKRKCRIGIMTESYNDDGLKGKLRAAKYRYYKFRYFRHISFVLAIGRQGVRQYSSLGYDSKRLFPWAYFITLDKEIAALPDENGVRMIYAGRLEEAKGIYKFLEQLCDTGKRNFCLDIYGAGPDEVRIRQLLKEKDLEAAISITPFIRYDELLKKYAQYNWVVLPSTAKDGWGVVVSEGLLQGLKAICSRKCGVSWAIKEGVNGVTFDWMEADGCKSAINKMWEGNFAAPAHVKAMAQNSISGDAGAKYFMKIIQSVYHGAQKPGIPWDA